MNDTNPGTIVTSTTARRVIYGTFVVALIIIGGIQVAYSAVPGWGGQPDWLTAALAVGAYLGIPVGSLALANAPRPAPVVPEADPNGVEPPVA